MRLIEETRSYYKFLNELNIETDEYGIKTQDGMIWFPRNTAGSKSSKKAKTEGIKTFESIDDCENWLREKMEFEPHKKIYKRLYDIQTKFVEITDVDWELMKTRMRHPEKFDKKDFRIYEDFLANNWRDRDQDRFSLGVLGAFNKTIPGKQRLIGHSWDGPGYGRYFKSRIEKVTIEQAIEIMKENAERKDLLDLMKFIMDRDGGLFILVPSFYVRNSETRKEIIDDLDAGIGGDSSIGFRADKKIDVSNEDGNLLFHEYIDEGNTEALEGSDVWLGSQRGSTVRKNADDEEENTIVIEEAIKPYANEHACRLKEPGQYERFARKNCYKKHDGKCIDFIFGIKSDKSELQALRFKKDIWTAGSAKSYCEDKGGSFEAAKEAENIEKKEWTTEYINTLEDNCFAVVELTDKKDDEGRTLPKNARHLPHHKKGSGATGTGGTVDLPYLRNVLARANQIKPVTDKISAESLRSKVRKHLIAHAKDLGVGDYDVSEGGIMKIRVESIDFEKEVELTEDSMKEFQSDIENKICSVVEDSVQTKEELDAIKSILGDDVAAEKIRELKRNAEAGGKYREFLIGDTVKFQCLLKLLENDPEKIKAEKELLAGLSIENIEAQRNKYQKKFEMEYPWEQLPSNLDDLNQDKRKDKELMLESKNSYQTID